MNFRIMRCLPIGVVIGCAVVVSANPPICFTNYTVNTCHQLPTLTPPGPDSCVYPTSINSCTIGVEGNLLSEITGPTTATCTFVWGEYDENDVCQFVEGDEFTSLVQCSVAIGACGSGGGH